MMISPLLEGIEYKILPTTGANASAELSITGVCSDSRACNSGTIFIPLTGLDRDGHDFVGDALARGCRAFLWQKDRAVPKVLMDAGAVVVEVADTNVAYSRIAANFYDHPAEMMKLVAVTGTNGKTTVTYLLEHILLKQGLAVGIIGTVNNRYTPPGGDTVILATKFTTPEAVMLQQLLREMADAGVQIVIMEVSSHALSQARVGTLNFAVAAFTNISRDHLDYHRDMEDYFQAKCRLFENYLQPGGVAVVPAVERAENHYLIRLHEAVGAGSGSRITWGQTGADISLVAADVGLEQTAISVATPAGIISLTTPLVGRFNTDNILCVLGLVHALGLSLSDAAMALADAKGAPGRLERVSPGEIWPSGGPIVLVDYAHSPDALEKVLTTIKALPHRQLFCIFGCGGDRDRGKRPVMGGIVSRLADVAIVTDDNPRTEDGGRIVAQILPGVVAAMSLQQKEWLSRRQDGERGCVIIRDRKEAIECAIRSAGPNDLVLIAGKGHEPYQLTLQGKRFFDDRQEALRVLLSWTEKLVARATGGRLVRTAAAERLLGEISTDSRKAGNYTVFVALKGENHDGHDFAGQAVANGARCLVVERELQHASAIPVGQIMVPDTLVALGALTAFRRRQVGCLNKPIIIGLTGSCGKTTVKEMVAAILARKWPEGPDHPPECVLKTKGNLNNLIGVPLSLLPLDNKHRAAVIEMGMNAPGELTRLGAMVAPDISCITNVHGAHLEGLGSIEGVARAKEELFAATPLESTLIINLDDPHITAMAAGYSQRRVTFAITDDEGGSRPDFHASHVRFDRDGGIRFALHHHEKQAEVQLFTAGEHNVANGLAAAAIASAAGATLADIVAGLGDFRPPDKRMVMMRGATGYTVINDTYNANPASMAAGLRTLAQLGEGRKIAIIGDMLELGASSGAAHREIGRLAALLHLDHLVVAGEFQQAVVDGAIDAGYPAEKVIGFADKEKAVERFLYLASEKSLGQDDVVLVKASRGLRFETIIERITSQS
jgi:murE/murF fusion protein